MSLIPEDETNRIHREIPFAAAGHLPGETNAIFPAAMPPIALTIWGTTREGGRIISRPHVETGPVFQFMLSGHEVPFEWLERAIPINFDDDEEGAPCR